MPRRRRTHCLMQFTSERHEASSVQIQCGGTEQSHFPHSQSVICILWKLWRRGGVTRWMKVTSWKKEKKDREMKQKRWLGNSTEGIGEKHELCLCSLGHRLRHTCSATNWIDSSSTRSLPSIWPISKFPACDSHPDRLNKSFYQWTLHHMFIWEIGKEEGVTFKQSLSVCHFQRGPVWYLSLLPVKQVDARRSTDARGGGAGRYLTRIVMTWWIKILNISCQSLLQNV